MTIIVDTSAILTAFDERHELQHQVANTLINEPGPFIVSPMIVAEADYMLFKRLGAAAARRFAQDVITEAYELAEWTAADHGSALAVVDQYGDDYVGVADASNVVLADRYRTTKVLTLDHRHFRTLRPMWGADHFTLLPADR